MCHDAVEVLHTMIPDNSLNMVQLFFPDPWHKARHNKRRIVQPPFAELVKSKLKLGGVFHMATDWEAMPCICWKSCPRWKAIVTSRQATITYRARNRAR